MRPQVFQDVLSPRSTLDLRAGDQAMPYGTMQPFFPEVLAPLGLPEVVPENHPAPWEFHDLGQGLYAVFSDPRRNVRTNQPKPNYVGLVHCPSDDKDVLVLQTRIRLINAQNPEKPEENAKLLPWYIAHTPEHGDYEISIFASNGKKAKNDVDYRVPEGQDSIEDHASIVAQHNQEMVDALRKRFQTSNPSTIAEVAAAEYSRLQGAFFLEGRDFKSRFFSAPQIRTIATLFKQSGRPDLAEEVNGVSLANELWTQMQRAADDQGYRLFFELEHLLGNEYFEFEETGIPKTGFEDAQKKFYASRARLVLENIRSTLKEKPSPALPPERLESAKRDWDILFVESLGHFLECFEIAGISTLEEAGLTPEEAENIRTMVEKKGISGQEECRKEYDKIVLSERYAQFFRLGHSRQS